MKARWARPACFPLVAAPSSTATEARQRDQPGYEDVAMEFGVRSRCADPTRMAATPDAS